MARPRLAPEVLAHLEWLGFVQPTGLVVSAGALVKAGAILDRRDVEGQLLLKECLAERTADPAGTPQWFVPDFEAFARRVLGWSFAPKYYAGGAGSPVPAELEVALPEYGETLRADFAVRERDPQAGGQEWQMLVRVLEPGDDFDRVQRGSGRLEASAHGRMERLLRQTGVRTGVLFNGASLRLVSAPRGESSGWLDFQVADMLTTAGRPICTAMRLLLNERRLLTLPRAERLTGLLEDSRKYQNEVSERLAEQVLHALYELLRGFQSAHDAGGGELLRRPLAEHPDQVYHALLTVLLRLVFLLYAEERGMLPGDDAFVNYYSIAGLHKRLLEDDALFPDTMDQRFGAWAQLVALFRMVHDGAEAGRMRLPERHGVLFDPDRFPFLEGRGAGGARQIHERIEAPLVPDGTVYRALEKLLVLDGERISYRALDVEQIGSVYETMMGFRLKTAHGRSLAIKPAKRLGAPVTVDLEALLGVTPEKRDKWFADQTARKPAAGVKKGIEAAASLDELHAALEPLIDREATPDVVPPGSMVLQPSEERRRSGSHYTPRSLTEPIVRTTLAPILERLSGADGAPPAADQLLDLKVCDWAMGSGAFLVETCRQLGDALIESWQFHGGRPSVPADEDEVVFARRLVAQRCLYGVDRNPVAVDLAKMSLWLATLAREHPLTFVDHALKHGDSLVGLTRAQIEGFHWDADVARERQGFVSLRAREHIERAVELRSRIRSATDDVPEGERTELLRQADDELDQVKLLGDLVLAAFFSGEKRKDRETKLTVFADAVQRGEAGTYRSWLEEWRTAERPLAPFHWELEFPEVFERGNPGFDAIVGNPPFLGGSRISAALGTQYADWLLAANAGAHGNADLVAYFFRRAFGLVRDGGAFGLIATNTIAQGDTRHAGLTWICGHGGSIYCALRRVRWPGQASVVVSVVHVTRGASSRLPQLAELDGRHVQIITAYLFHRGAHEDPARLAANAGLSFRGTDVYGVGFTFDDEDAKGIATPLEDMHSLVESNPGNADVIWPLIGGEELNSSPTLAPRRYVINFGQLSEEECWRRWPELIRIVDERVKPERMKLKDNPDGRRRKEYWWQFGRYAAALFGTLEGLGRAMVIAQTSRTMAFAFLPTRIVYSQKVIAFPLETHAAFAAVQSRVHELWARFFGSTMKDDAVYTPSDCFETFPFPEAWESRPDLESVGKTYYEFRADLMVRNNEGLTKTYNRFHDPEEDSPDIIKLRELHAAMDRAVLDAYGWTDIPTACEFLLDYEVDEEESSRKKKPWRYRWPDEV
ncbi:MAG: DNA methyltransferase, partial [Actinomycetes bacterium]